MGISMAAFLFSLDSSFLGSCAFSIFSLSLAFCLIYLQSWVVASLPSALWLLSYSFISCYFFINSGFSCAYTISEVRIQKEEEDRDRKVTQFAIGKPQPVVCVQFSRVVCLGHATKISPNPNLLNSVLLLSTKVCNNYIQNRLAKGEDFPQVCWKYPSWWRGWRQETNWEVLLGFILKDGQFRLKQNYTVFSTVILSMVTAFRGW